MTDRSSSTLPVETPPAASAGGDRYTYGWLITFGLYFLFLAYGNEFDRILNLWMLLVPFLLLPGLVIVACWLVVFVINIVRRHWRRLVSQLGAPFIAAMFFALLGAAGVNPQSIRLAVNKRSYLAEIAKLPDTGEPRFHSFKWGETGGAAVANFFFTLVFDETDEIGLPPGLRSEAWVKRHTPPACVKEQQCAVYESAGGKTVTVEPMGDHFFLVTELYQ